MRHLISLTDITDEDLRHLVHRGTQFSAGAAGRPQPLAGLVAGVYFRKTSTRTRTAFATGAMRLGAHVINYGPEDLQTNTGETFADTGRVFARMLDLLVARTSGDPAELRGYADQDRMAVINAMTADEHPTQGLTDLTTLAARFGRLDGLRVLYLGEGNNSAAAIALALSRFPGTELHLRTPPGYGLHPDVLARATTQADAAGSRVLEHHHMLDLPTGVDAIYTTRWETTGTSKADPDWRAVFRPFQVTGALWEDSPKAVFLHDLPAHRGAEVTGDVLDGPASIAFDQAENKLHSAMAVLEWCHLGIPR